MHHRRQTPLGGHRVWAGARALVPALFCLAAGCHWGNGTAPQSSPPVDPALCTGAERAAAQKGESWPTSLPASGDSGLAGRWCTLYEESFQQTSWQAPQWRPDDFAEEGPFSEGGAFHQQAGITPPQAWRASMSLGQQDWLTAELYSRDKPQSWTSLLAVVADPAAPAAPIAFATTNRVLRLSPRAHTDGVIVRSTDPLPRHYRLTLKVGFADFGDGEEGNNGYDGDEQAGPWLDHSAQGENGFYWVTVLDTLPRPHNNLWIHHHRKVVLDTDNHYPPWMEIFDGEEFTKSGVHPVMLFVVDGQGEANEHTGKPFISWADGTWQPSGKIRAVDAYLPNQWYTVVLERWGHRFTLEVSGRFQYGGQTTYRASIDAREHCVWHFNRPDEEAPAACLDESYFPSLGPEFPFWPAGKGWPDYFMFGDPHINYYEGTVHYDQLKLETWVASTS